MPARSPFSRSVIGAGAALISATLVANVVVAAEAGSASGGEGASSAGIAAPSSPSPDRDIAGLLMTAESQIAAGHLNAPVGDNATDTLQAVLRRAVLAPQSARDVIDRMASRFEERALAAEAAGDAEQAARFRAFRDAFAFPHLEPRKDSVTQAQSLATLRELPPMPPDAAASRSGSDRAAPNSSGTDASAAVAEPAAQDAAAPGQGPDLTAHPFGTDNTPGSYDPKTETPSGAAPAPGPDPGSSPAGLSESASPQPAGVDRSPDATGVVAALIRRGDQALVQGDISAARLLYQRAAASGSAGGMTGLARTYDPVFLGHIGARGIQPDPALAQRWYQQAVDAGASSADEPLRVLSRWKLDEVRRQHTER